MEGKTKPRRTGVTKKSWVIISGVAFFISFSAAVFLILFGHQLAEYGMTDKIYYLILIPLGFSSAAFLSGAMNSSALYQSGDKPYGKLELGGPIVIFVMVVGGGIYIPKLLEDSTTLDLKIRVYSDERETSSFEKGVMKLYIEDKTYTGNINDGEVVFSTIPKEYHNTAVRVEALIEGYQVTQGTDFKLSKNIRVIELKLDRRPEFLTTNVRGNVSDENGYPVQDAIINFASGLATGTTNEIGDFNFSIPSEPGTKMPLKIFVDGKIKFNENVTLSSQTPYNFKITKNP